MPFAFTVNALLIQDIIDILLHAKRGIFTNCVAFFATCSYLTGIFIAIGHVRFQSLFFLAIYVDIKAIERISLWIQVQAQQMADQGTAALVYCSFGPAVQILHRARCCSTCFGEDRAQSDVFIF